MERFMDIDKFIESYDEREQAEQSVRQSEGRRQKKSQCRRRASRKSAMTGIFVDSDEWTQWIVCTFKDEEMRFQVGPFGPRGGIQRRVWTQGDWSEWMDAEGASF